MKKEKNMNFTISKEIIQETSKCEYYFSCLKPEEYSRYPTCTVDYANGHNILFLKEDKWLPCPYQLPFGFGMVCTCPTHFAIHKAIVTMEILNLE